MIYADAKKEDGMKKKENTTKHIVDCSAFTVDVSDSGKFTINIQDCRNFTVNISDCQCYSINRQDSARIKGEL